MSDAQEQAVLRKARAAQRAAGSAPVNWHKLARQLGVGYDWLRRRLDHVYRERRCAMVNRNRGHGGWNCPSKDGIPLGEGYRMPREELARRKALIPEDTRDFTARLMGDPIPNDPRRQVSP